MSLNAIEELDIASGAKIIRNFNDLSCQYYDLLDSSVCPVTVAAGPAAPILVCALTEQV